MYLKDEENTESLIKMLQSLEKLSCIEEQIRNFKQQQKNNFLQRIYDPPFQVVPAQDPFKNSGIENIDENKTTKRMIKSALLMLHVHPCYLINLYRNQKVDPDTFLRILIGIYPNKFLNSKNTYDPSSLESGQYLISIEAERVNYMLIIVFNQIVQEEIQKFKTLEEVDFLKEDCLIGKLFKYIFRSQSINIDQICQIAAHMLNYALKAFSFNQEDQADTKKTDKDINKIYKSSELMVTFFDFVQDHIIQSTLDNKILCQNTIYFQHRRVIFNFIKEHQLQQFPQLKFSSEVGTMIEILANELFKLPYAGDKLITSEEVISQKIIGLVFYKFQKVWENYEIYLFPYLKSKKYINLIQKQIQTNQQTYDALVEIFIAFCNGKQAFQQANSEPAVIELNAAIKYQLSKFRVDFFKQIQEKSNTIGLVHIQTKNLENLVQHCMSTQDFTLHVQGELIYRTFKLLINQRKNVALQLPAEEDNLFKIIMKIKPKTLKNLNGLLSLKLPTRLLLDSKDLQCCSNCMAIITPQFFSQQKQSILDQYEPENQESLNNVYCEVLKNIQELGSEHISLQVKNFSKGVKKFSKAEVINMVHDFHQRLIHECEIRDDDENFVQKIDFKYQEMLLNAQNRINLRRKHIHKIQIQKQKFEDLTQNAIEFRYNTILTKDYQLYQTVITNTLFGLSNQELKRFAQNEASLQKMRQILSQLSSQNASSNITGSLQKEQKLMLRSVIRKSVWQLVNDGVITDIKLDSLKKMVHQLTLIVSETPTLDFDVKLSFVDTVKVFMCFTKQLKPQLLLEFQIKQNEIIQLRKQLILCQTLRLNKPDLTVEQKKNKKIKSEAQEQQETTIQQLSVVTYLNTLQFDAALFLRIINQLVRQRYSYMFNTQEKMDGKNLVFDSEQ